VLVAPGFGERGIEGKISTIKFVRENNIPFLGICLGMQCAVIEFARNVLGYKDAHSSEMNSQTKHAVIDLLEDQKKIVNKGGTMRLGAYACTIKENTLASKIYKSETISERHRHRYEFNNKYLDEFVKAGMLNSGMNSKTHLVEIVEIPGHPFFIGVQFHPEYKSTVAQPHPLFVNFVAAALKQVKKD
jgi:CTP synthase